MRKWFVSAVLAAGCAATLVSDVSAQVQIQVQVQPAAAQPKIQPGVKPRPGGGPMMVRPANPLTPVDAVFVGRVVAFEPMDVEAPQAEGQPKIAYRVAVVQISEAIYGLKKDTKQVRIAFVAQAGAAPGNPGGGAGGVQILPAPAIQPLPPGGGGLRRPFPGNFPVQLQMGQEGLFRVDKHFKESFFLTPTNTQFVNKDNNANFDADVKTAKQIGKIMSDPVAALKSEDKQERYLAAAMLVSKYRAPANPTGKALKQEPIDAAESKLILQAIAGGEWKAGVFNSAIPGPFELFNQLGITQKDGYNPLNVRTQQEIFAAMQKWLDENNGKYVINKMVPDPDAKAQPGVVQPQPGVVVPPPVIKPGVRPLPVKPGVQPLPAPAPAPPAPVQIDEVQVVPQVAPLPVRRDN